MIKKRYLMIPVLAIVSHLLLSNLLYFSVEKLFLNVFPITKSQITNYSYWGEILIYAILIMIFFVFYKILWNREDKQSCAELNCKNVGISLIAGLGVSGISFVWILLVEQLPSLQKSLDAMNTGSKNIAGGNLFGTFMIAVVCAPIIEELLFRGIVFRSIRKISSPWIAILISSALFGAYHMNLVQAVYATLMGIVAAIIYEKKANLLFPIFVHVANNTVAMAQSFLPSNIDEMLNILGVVMMFPLGYILYCLLKDKRVATEKIQPLSVTNKSLL